MTRRIVEVLSLPEHRTTGIWILCGLTLLVAVAARFFQFLELSEHLLITHPQLDAQYYHRLARDGVKGLDLGTRVLWSAPGYPVFLRLVYGVFGIQVKAAVVVQQLIGALMAVLLVRTMARESMFLGILTAFWSIYPVKLYYECLLLPTSVIVDLNAFCFCLLRSRRWRECTTFNFAMGVAWASLCSFKETYLYFSIVVLIFLIRGARARFAFIVGILLVIGPTSFRNYQLTGELIPLSAHGGEVLYMANNPKTDGLFNPMQFGHDKIRGHERKKREASLMVGRSLTYGESNRYWISRFVKFVVARPGRFLGLVFNRARFVAQQTELPNNYDYRYFRSQSFLLRTNPLHFGVILPLGVMGLFLAWPFRRRFRVLYWMFLSNLLPLAILFPTSRFRMPLALFVFLAAGVGLWIFFARIRGQRRSRWSLFVVLGVTLAVAWWANRPRPRLDSGTDWSLRQMGQIALGEGKSADAVRYFEEALKIERGNSESLFGLAKAWAAAGDPAGAYRLLRRLDRKAPGKRRIQKELVRLLILMKQCSLAELYIEALPSQAGTDSYFVAAKDFCEQERRHAQRIEEERHRN